MMSYSASLSAYKLVDAKVKVWLTGHGSLTCTGTVEQASSSVLAVRESKEKGSSLCLINPGYVAVIDVIEPAQPKPKQVETDTRQVPAEALPTEALAKVLPATEVQPQPKSLGDAFKELDRKR